MDKLTRYRQQLQLIVEEYSSFKPSYGEVDVEAIIDPVRDHFQVMTVGWNGYQRIHGCLLHMDIKDGKIWIQHDGTEEGVANRLIEAGVPKSDIVLAFQMPFKRRFTEFAQG